MPSGFIFRPYKNHQIIEKAFRAFKKNDLDSLQIEHARETQHSDAKRFLTGKYIKIPDPSSGAFLLYKVLDVKEFGAGAETLFTLRVVSGERYRSCLLHGGDESLLARTEVPISAETEIWVGENC